MENFEKGDIVVVIERHASNEADIGMVVELICIEKGNIPYLVKDKKGFIHGSSWCRGVRKATQEEINNYLGIPTESDNYQIY